MTETRPMRTGILLIGLLALTACAGVTRIPEDSFYRLDPVAPAARLAQPALDGILSVQVGADAPLYRDRALLYSESATPDKLQRYHYHYWIDTPPHLLQHGLADHLRAAGIAAAVVVPEDGMDENYRLRLAIRRFEHVRGVDGGKVVVDLDLRLNERATGRLLLQEQLQAEGAVNGAGFPAVASAYRQVVAGLYEDILMRLSTLQRQVVGPR